MVRNISHKSFGAGRLAICRRRWNKPSIMVTCEANYSNAHGTPWVYQHQGIGKVVGMPVPGTMTSVSWETLQDPTLYFWDSDRRLPFTGR